MSRRLRSSGPRVAPILCAALLAIQSAPLPLLHLGHAAGEAARAVTASVERACSDTSFETAGVPAGSSHGADCAVCAALAQTRAGLIAAGSASLPSSAQTAHALLDSATPRVRPTLSRAAPRAPPTRS